MVKDKILSTLSGLFIVGALSSIRLSLIVVVVVVVVPSDVVGVGTLLIVVVIIMSLLQIVVVVRATSCGLLRSCFDENMQLIH